MKDKIYKEILEWCQNKDIRSEMYMEDFISVVIDKTTENLFNEIQNELKNEFERGNLKQPLMISDEYYLYLKLKEIKNKLTNPLKDSDFIENEKKKKEE